MALKRFAIELGYAADLHGEDMTKAAVRAVRDAVSRVCLCGLVEICGRGGFEGVHVHADVAVPEPDAVDADAVLACIPIGEKTLTLIAPGVSNIVAACAALTVSIDDEVELGAGDTSHKHACGCAAKAE